MKNTPNRSAMDYNQPTFWLLGILVAALVPTLSYAGDTITVKGQAFVQTLDSGPMKLAAMKVYAIPLVSLSEFPDPADIPDPSKVVNLPKPYAATSTDADGHFTLALDTDRPFFVYASGGYYTKRGRYIGFEWKIPQDSIPDRENLTLDNNNSKTPGQKVVIATD
jgi:galactose mutarotase-like enzyme